MQAGAGVDVIAGRELHALLAESVFHHQLAAFIRPGSLKNTVVETSVLTLMAVPRNG